jgi:hypothetical protein
MTENLRNFPDYALFVPPADLADRTPRDWNPREARLYFDWFLNEIPERCAQLKRIAAGISEHIDCSPDSLEPLGQWFVLAITVRKMTSEEIDRELAGMSERGRRMGVGG